MLLGHHRYYQNHSSSADDFGGDTFATLISCIPLYFNSRLFTLASFVASDKLSFSSNIFFSENLVFVVFGQHGGPNDPRVFALLR